MNYSDIITELETASGFDLFRLKVAIDRMLDDPKLILQLKSILRIGQEVEYFLPDENRTVKATIEKFKRTQVSVRDIADGKAWSIPYYFINIHSVDTSIVGSVGNVGLGRNEVKVNDLVGFTGKDNNEKYGVVERLNQKTVSLNCGDERWRVSYSCLFKVVAPDIPAIESQ